LRISSNMRTPKAILIWEEVMPTLVGFGTFAALFEEQISEKISRRVLPRAARQRCLAHRMRNLASKVPEEVWPEFKARVQAAYQAPSRAIARELAAGVVAFPVTHRRGIRTTNLLERLFVEERRRLKIIPNAFGERAVLKLMFGALPSDGAPSRSPSWNAGR
jgi:transposase-like protein